MWLIPKYSDVSFDMQKNGRVISVILLLQALQTKPGHSVWLWMFDFNYLHPTRDIFKFFLTALEKEINALTCLPCKYIPLSSFSGIHPTNFTMSPIALVGACFQIHRCNLRELYQHCLNNLLGVLSRCCSG